MNMLGGIAVILGIIVVAGLIAYLGDRVGHQVGRKRLSLFGLRPRYTSTIVAVATGMMIALVVTLTALLASNYARAAFFHLSDINNRINELQSQADQLQRLARQGDVVVNRGDLLYDPFLKLEPTEAKAERLRSLSAFFDAVVKNVNKTLVPRGLKAFRGRAADPATQKKLEAFLADERVQALLAQGPILLIATADQNLFANDPIHFQFLPYADKRVFRKGQVTASVDVDGGSSPNSIRIAFTQVLGKTGDLAVKNGMPIYYSRPVPFLGADAVQKMVDEIRRGRGRYRVVATAMQDIVPSTGGIPLGIAVVRAGP